MESDQTADRTEPPEIGSWLLALVEERRDAYERQFGDQRASGINQTEDAIKSFSEHASDFFHTGVVPDELITALEAFMPGASLAEKIRHLFAYEVVSHRVEFDVARDVSTRLFDLDRRVMFVAALTTLVLHGYAPTSTVLKYFYRAASLYLAGYDPETVIVCGAALEAALSDRFPNSALRAARYKPAFSKIDEYAVGQRMRFEREVQPIFSERERRMMTDLNSWRIDAIHVQIDITPQGSDALANLAFLLPTILPR